MVVPTEPDLSRFVAAQEGVYERALAEVRSGRKRTHWMWFIFPQLDGLGVSEMARFYGIRDAEEARAYLRHPVLGRRLEEIARAAYEIPELSASEVFGSPDDVKLRSCATLFSSVSAQGSIFTRLLDRFFEGRPDPRTLDRLASR